MEARADEAQQDHGKAQMPSLGEARMALAIHGRKEGFRVVLVSFDTEEQAEMFDHRVAGNRVRTAVRQAVYHNANLEVLQ